MLDVFDLMRLEHCAPPDLARRQYDVFVSGLNSSERVAKVFEAVDAREKWWVVHPEYGYRLNTSMVKGSMVYAPEDGVEEAEFWAGFLDEVLRDRDLSTLSLAIDVTGMMRPHIALLPVMLVQRGLSRVDFLYSEPAMYASGAQTAFSGGGVSMVRQVQGFEGRHVPESSDDVLIIGAGYDSSLVRAVAESKRNCAHYVVVGLPGLQAQMYQESQLRLAAANESLKFADANWRWFAPANNPLATASVLLREISRLRASRAGRNVYLSPLGAKSQVLGFALYFLAFERDKASSLTFPFSPSYSRETSTGFTSVSICTVELDALASVAPPG